MGGGPIWIHIIINIFLKVNHLLDKVVDKKDLLSKYIRGKKQNIYILIYI